MQNSNGDEVVSAQIAQDRCVELGLRASRLDRAAGHVSGEEVETRAPNEQDPRVPRELDGGCADRRKRGRRLCRQADDRDLNQP